MDSSTHPSLHRHTITGPGVPRVEGAVLAQQQQAAPAPVAGLGMVTSHCCSIHLDTTPHGGYHQSCSLITWLLSLSIVSSDWKVLRLGSPGLSIWISCRLGALLPAHTAVHTTQ